MESKHPISAAWRTIPGVLSVVEVDSDGNGGFERPVMGELAEFREGGDSPGEEEEHGGGVERGSCADGGEGAFEVVLGLLAGGLTM